jgi:trk system potassium uptake protein TrkA
MYLVIIGAGEIGTPLISLAASDGHDVVVVEKDPEVADAAAKLFDCLVLNQDGTRADVLEDAGITDADAVVSTTDSDATNVMTMLLADDYDVPTRVSVVRNEDHMSLFHRIGVTTIENPQRLIAEYLYRAVHRPSIEDVLHLAGDAEVFEISVSDRAPLSGHSLAEANERGFLGDDGVLVVAVERGDEVITPRGDTVIQPGDDVTVFSKDGIDPEITHLFAPEDDP